MLSSTTGDSHGKQNRFQKNRLFQQTHMFLGNPASVDAAMTNSLESCSQHINCGPRTNGSDQQTKELVAANLSDFLDYAGNDRTKVSITDLDFLTQVLD
jgi:hypothetical protein